MAEPLDGPHLLSQQHDARVFAEGAVVTELEEYQRARDRVQEVKGFYAHAVMFLVANAALAILNLTTLKKNDGAIWFIWPLIGWGVVLVVHAISVFGIGRFLGRGWEQRQIQRELDRRHKDPRT
ncbi:hypothetical protein SMC6_01355 [Candidatus Cryosericum odellii]|uniref:2TM domain-containing protein n=1 Tax=Candidatus Cryosericum odellii TaxID=2290917 RepID=A0A398DV77_9BACT|nr:hypothetical protein SMC6_01355 [Candidatus Cryosericum odellii]RIE15194.1 hypothetical protein SMC5_01270 [Candidatus Cryosericum odellii]